MAEDTVQEVPVNPAIEAYRNALEAAMDDFMGKQGPMYLSTLRQAFMAGAMFQLKFNSQAKQV